MCSRESCLCPTLFTKIPDIDCPGIEPGPLQRGTSYSTTVHWLEYLSTRHQKTAGESSPSRCVYEGFPEITERMFRAPCSYCEAAYTYQNNKETNKRSN
jgi:hypothetical protein